MEEIFPELKESEDERIRKDIIAFLKADKPFADNETLANWISWLEKQGEQKQHVYGENEAADRLVSIAECLEMDGDCSFNGHTGSEQGEFLRSIARDMFQSKNSDFDRGYAVGLSANKYTSWKPSSKQMKVLKIAAESLPAAYSNILDVLYEDLKNL